VLVSWHDVAGSVPMQCAQPSLTVTEPVGVPPEPHHE
jgi:hypothetical protein